MSTDPSPKVGRSLEYFLRPAGDPEAIDEFDAAGPHAGQATRSHIDDGSTGAPRYRHLSPEHSVGAGSHQNRVAGVQPRVGDGIDVDPPPTQHVVPGSEPLAEGARDLFARQVGRKIVIVYFKSPQQPVGGYERTRSIRIPATR